MKKITVIACLLALLTLSACGAQTLPADEGDVPPVEGISQTQEVWSWHPRSAAIRWMQDRCLQTWGLQTGHRTSLRSFPAGNSSVWRSPVPLPKIRSFCCAMNQPARWITIQVRQC